MFEAARDGILIVDPTSRKITDVNPFLLEFLGYRRDQVIGKELFEIGLLKDEQASRDAFVHLQAHGFIRYEDLPLQTKSGEQRAVEVVSNLYEEDGGQVIQCNIRDITARKAIEAELLSTERKLQESTDALRTYNQTLERNVIELRTAKTHADTAARNVLKAAERFRLLSEVVALQVWTATPEGILDYANSEFVEYFGVDVQHDVFAAGWVKFIHPEESAAVLASWEKSVSLGVDFEAQFRLRSREGVYCWFLSRAHTMRDLEGNVIKWIGANTNINDLKNAQGIAERASRAKDDFLAALSHELRTPLTPVLMTAAALREDERLPDDARELLGMIERNIGLEARLIDDLLDLTKIANGKLQLRAQPCDAHYLVGMAVEIVREDALAKDITIRSSFTAKNSALLADPARFQQVIWNLVRNAVKFTPRGGQILVSTTDLQGNDGEEWLRIEVKDTGIGIEPQRLQQIFQPFDQGGLRGQHQYGGVGLGLAIARAVVELHSGRISAESAGTGTGSLFVVELPAQGGPHAVAVALPPRAAVLPAVPLRILVVEDHPSTRQTLCLLLGRDGHHVVPVGSMAEALIAAALEPFDLVISDLGLPDGTGDDLMTKLRATYGLRGIALSGYGSEDDVGRSKAAGFFTHLVKPVSISDLRTILVSVPRKA